MELSLENYHIKIALILAIGFSLASILGYFSQRAKLSPILGYLIAGYLIGPYSPGFVADATISEQLAEIGVILMMFGVGLHLKWQELVNVKNIAITGAIVQTLITTVIGAYIVHMLGWSIEAGIVIGLSIGVASTVVMIRVLEDNHLMSTPHGLIAIGWLIVEDILTVIALLLLPALASSVNGESISTGSIVAAIAIALFKCLALLIITFFVGIRCASYILSKIARTRSQELLTLAVLGMTFGIAIGSALIFGSSIALGAFIAGLVIGQSEVRHQAAANALPLKDTFAVVFFLSVGMLFNPGAVWANFPLFIGVMVIILLIKPLIAYLIVVILKRPFQIALGVAVLLAQIGEFSFILSEEAMKLHILPEEGYDIIVACAIVSIALNPLLFKITLHFGKWVQRTKNRISRSDFILKAPEAPRAVIVGFGPIGQDAAKILEMLDLIPVIIDTNVDTISKQKSSNLEAVFGDASIEHILVTAHTETANLLVITTPEIETTLKIIHTARRINPEIQIVARSLYTRDKSQLIDLEVSIVCDEDEARQAFSRAILKQRT